MMRRVAPVGSANSALSGSSTWTRRRPYRAHMSWYIRRARADDMASVAEIVNHHIERSVAHFGDRAQTAAEWTADWEAHDERYPWLVAERRSGDDAMAPSTVSPTPSPSTRVRHMAGPRRSPSTCATDARVRAWAPRSYGRLIPILDAQGYRCLIAGITTPNDASVRLHEVIRLPPPGDTRAGRLQARCLAQRRFVAAARRVRG